MNKDQLKQETSSLIDQLTDQESEDFLLFLKAMERKKKYKNSTYIGALLQPEEKEEGKEFTLTIPNTPLIQNSLNIVHGGMTATLADSAMGTLAARLLPPHLAAVTAELKINYTAPGIGSRLTCKSSCIHHGSKTLLMEARIYRDDGKLAAYGTATFFIISRKK
ncbi:hotdog fold thioesterase [Bacillus mangrovi]|uniref:Hotdog fold thioesterase n=1 Tax=Metabacillus mangrovi TaxID=1491830 RepID=A0A7X2V427_9BACI|nr:PaaI family thioesterase [Metabacillus mangrovi]MTH52603.1 hotdog fold thioesterase [Metabacillus mangrovi]